MDVMADIPMTVSASEQVFDLQMDAGRTIGMEVDAKADIPMAVSTSEQVFDLQMDAGRTIGMEVDTVVVSAIGEQHYQGETEITPGEDEQVLATAGTVVDEDIRVAAVPSNYGRIAWNGSALLVY